MKDFTNSVLSFSWQTDREDLPGIERPTVEVDPSMPAFEVARLAERNSLPIVAVRGADQKTLGFFLPEYLAEVLPDHPLPKERGVVVDRTAGLAEMIAEIDDAGLDFHSELVNLAPNLRRCPRGHLVRGPVCPTHGVPTEDWL